MRRPPPDSIAILVALTCVVAAVAGASTLWRHAATRDGARSELVLYVDEPAFVGLAGKTAGDLDMRIRQREKGHAPQLELVGVPLGAPDELRRLVLERKPRLVILANDDLAALITPPRLPTCFLVSSEQPPGVIQERFGTLREQQCVSFVSWVGVNQPKLTELAGRLAEGRSGRVSVFVHRASGTAALADMFTPTRPQDVSPQLVLYDDFADFERRFEERAAADMRAAVIPISGALFDRVEEVANVVERRGIPAVYSRRDQVRAGGLMSSDGPEDEIHDQLARYAVLLLHGADGSRLAVAEPSRYEIMINLAAARRAGITVPYEILVEARHFIER